MTSLALNLRRWNSTPTALALAGALVLANACGKDDPKGGGGDGSSSGSSSGDPTTGTTSSTTAMADSSSGGVDGSSSSDGGPVVLSISGIARDFFAMAPLVGAELSLIDEPGFETVTDDAGNYAIEGLAPDSFHRIAIAGNDSYWGAVVPARLGAESLDDYDLSQVSNDVIDIQIGALQMQDPMVTVDETAAVFLIALRQNTATGAVVTIDPPPPDGTYYAPDASGQPILNQNTIEWGLYPVAIVFNLPPAPEGTYTISVTHPERECTVEDPEPPTFERSINLVYVDCPAP